MDIFWFAAGLLTALAAAFVLLPLAATPGLALQQRVRQVRWPALAALIVIVAAVWLYTARGTPTPAGLGTAAGSSALPAHTAVPSAGAAGMAASAAASAGAMDVVLKQLEQRLAQRGGSDADWQLLAQTYDFLGRKDDAALARTHQLPATAAAATTDSTAADATPAPAAGNAAQLAAIRAIAATPKARALLASAESARRARKFTAAAKDYEQLAAFGALDAQGWADYADVAATLNGGRLAGGPQRQIDTALALDPNNEKALWLAASAQHETQRYADAVATWQRLLQLTPTGSADAKIFAANLQEDQGLAGAGSSAAVAAAAPAVTAATDSATAVISGEVTVSGTLHDKVPAGMTLFIVAKSLSSPGPPVAVLRTTTGQWPTQFRLDDSLAMLPGRNLSSAGRVTVEARVSRAGTALAQAGDFQSAVVTVDLQSHQPVRLLIDHVVGPG